MPFKLEGLLHYNIEHIKKRRLCAAQPPPVNGRRNEENDYLIYAICSSLIRFALAGLLMDADAQASTGAGSGDEPCTLIHKVERSQARGQKGRLYMKGHM